jgi:antirestriction protein ArdC
MAKQSPSRDLYSEVTATIVDSLESAGPWSRPWVQLGLGAANPRSIDGRSYRGLNTVLLWASALDNGYSSGTWGTFKAWLQRDEPTALAGVEPVGENGVTRCVRKGEKATLVTLWKPTKRKASDSDVAAGRASEKGENIDGLYLRHFNVFNAEQVDGYVPPEVPDLDPVERDADAEAFFSAIGSDLRHGGDRAFYSPVGDFITVPERDQFADGPAYYSTVAHEHGHWTGHESRLKRDFTGRFGDNAYAFEELVAELTAAFTCAHLGVAPSVREDHASYVKNWLKVLKEDDRAVFTAASQAQKATDYLVAAASVEAVEEVSA